MPSSFVATDELGVSRASAAILSPHTIRCVLPPFERPRQEPAAEGSRGGPAYSPPMSLGSGGLGRAAVPVHDRMWMVLADWAAIRPNGRRGRRCRSLGDGSAICFPVVALFGERYITVGAGRVIGPYVSLSAGVSPAHELGDRAVVTIGDRCLIGKGTGIVGHDAIDIGDDVFTGHNVDITDANHGYEDVDVPIGRQRVDPQPVRI